MVNFILMLFMLYAVCYIDIIHSAIILIKYFISVKNI